MINFCGLGIDFVCASLSVKCASQMMSRTETAVGEDELFGQPIVLTADVRQWREQKCAKNTATANQQVIMC